MRCDGGFVAIDLGWDGDEGWNLFTAGLARAGGGLDDLLGVVVTHAHPDHYGLAGRVREHTGAWIALHPAELPQTARTEAQRVERLTEIEDWVRRMGVPASRTDDLLSDRAQLMRDMPSQAPDRELRDGEAIPGTGGDLVAIHTPGHTPGHTVFHDRSRNVLFTGDHLLPRVSANISRRPTSREDPLGDYQRSLARLEPHGGVLAAPGHEWSFDRFDERLAVVTVHHQERLEEVLAAVLGGCGTVWEVANVVSWSRPFATLNPRGARSALGETLAHLVRLQREGRIRQSDGVPLRWRSTTGV
ncbi:MBL fold metallo-hydrolase [Nocardiopsis synnemataformans]|uniref:MBL fold metallo-hydrolase n=1 Tax=Nocardiopsis synnemataformans TaxID=61305 RepID=UPI003EBC7ECE